MYFICVWVSAFKCHRLYIEVKRTVCEKQSSPFTLFLRQDPSSFCHCSKRAQLWPLLLTSHPTVPWGCWGSRLSHTSRFCVGSRAQTQIVKLLRAKPPFCITQEAILRSSPNNPLTVGQWNPKVWGSLGSGLGKEIKQQHICVYHACTAADIHSMLPSTFI